MWLGSDGLTAVTSTNQTKAAEAMLGSVGIMPTGTLHFNSVTLALPQVGNRGLKQRRRRRQRERQKGNS